MKNRNDEFIANRIIWRAKNFKTINSCFFFEMDNKKQKEEIKLEFELKNGGEPVLINILNEKEWTSLGTNKLIWKSIKEKDKIELEQVLIDNIKETSPKNLNVKSIPDSKITFLDIHTKDDVTKTIKCVAKDLFQFTSILLMLERMQKNNITNAKQE